MGNRGPLAKNPQGRPEKQAVPRTAGPQRDRGGGTPAVHQFAIALANGVTGHIAYLVKLVPQNPVSGAVFGLILLVVMFVYAIEKHASEGLCFKGMIMVCVPTFGLVLVGFKTGNARLSEMQDERARAIHAKPFHYPPQHDDGAIENPRGQQW